MKIFAILLLVVSLFGCTILVGDDVETETYISIIDAGEIAKKYVTLNNYLWGAPNSVRAVKNVYMFTYFTPSDEVQNLGVRTLYVDMFTGAVTVLLRF